MGNMFRCTLKSGGASGTGIPLIVICSEDFAGKTITATDGTTTLTETCPSASPYTVHFDLPNTGSWTISGVIEGVTYSETITVTEYQLSLENGFSFKTWVSRGGLDPDDYASLSAVFADDAATRRLMLVHASADYLIDCVTDDITAIDDFCANDTAMKWLGLCDYVCDGLTAITGVKAKLLASTYWERYLKDHIPVMTGNTAPYGESLDSGATSNFESWKAFDGNDSTYWSANNTTASYNRYLGYRFTNPISVRKLLHVVSSGATNTLKVQYSDDGTNWVDTGDTYTISVSTSPKTIEVTESGYHLYWRVYSSTATAASDLGTYTLQFYGRALNVSVPVMTSDTAPYGKASASSVYQSSQNPWYAFNGSNSGEWHSSSPAPQWLQYHFPSKMKLKMVMLRNRNGSSANNNGVATFKMLGSNDGFVNDIHELSAVLTNPSPTTPNAVSFHDISTNEEYEDIRLNAITGQNTEYISIGQLQFYGVDYSEKEFEAGTTKKWLYDHGLELEPISEAVTTGGTITFGSDYVNLDRTNSNANLSIATDNTIDLTAYSMLFTIADTTKSSSIERIGVAASRTTGVSSLTTSKLVTMTGSDVKDGVDISAVDESQYVIVLANNVGAFNLKEIWVE